MKDVVKRFSARVNFGAPACVVHQGGEFSDPSLACRFAHMCDECKRITTEEVLKASGCAELVTKLFEMHRLGADLHFLHRNWDSFIEGNKKGNPHPQEARAYLVQKWTRAKKEFAETLQRILPGALVPDISPEKLGEQPWPEEVRRDR